MPAKLLIVEDEAIVALDLVHSLTRLGYDIIGFTGSGEQALNLAGSERPDLVLIDIRLNGVLDGLETAGRFIEGHGVPVVFVTAYSDETVLQQALATGASGYLLKPFQEADLHGAVEAALRNL